MSRAVRRSLAAAAFALFAATCAVAQTPPAPSDGRQNWLDGAKPGAKPAPPEPPASGEAAITDGEIDAILFRDRNGVEGSGEAVRLLSEIEPAAYVEFRDLLRRLVAAAREDKVEVMSDLLAFSGRLSDRIALAMRRAPLDALDAVIVEVRAAVTSIAATDPTLCGVYASGEQSDMIALRKTRLDLVTKIDTASYRAVAAARARPTTYPHYDDALYQRLREAMKAEGLPEERIEAFFSTSGLAALAPAAKCEVERGYFAALAGLPDEARGPVLAYHFSGDDGAGE